MSTIRLAGTVEQSITDGPGLRFTLFAQGCPHHCVGCHNPQTWSFDGGTDYKVEELLRKFDANPLLKGITLSGGEPLSQAEELLPLATAIKERKKDIVLYTGYLWEDLMNSKDPFVTQLLSMVDLLIDGPFILAQKDLTLLFRGSKNQRILRLPETILAGEPVLLDE